MGQGVKVVCYNKCSVQMLPMHKAVCCEHGKTIIPSSQFCCESKFVFKIVYFKARDLRMSCLQAFYSKLIPSCMSVTQLFTVFYALFPQMKLNHMNGRAWLQAEQILLKVK